jgi:hypothetical protein
MTGRSAMRMPAPAYGLLGQGMMPAMREIGKELGLKDPFETNAPVHLRYSTDLKQIPQAAE